MIKYLNSKSNDNIKLLKSLFKKKYRDKMGLYVVEGRRIIEHGFENEIEFHSVFFSEDSVYVDGNEKLIELLESVDLPVYKLESELFKSMADTENSQGFMAIVKKKEYNFDKEYHKSILFIDRVQDPGNLGTIIRTADSAGVDLIVYNKGTVDPFNSKTVRSAMGSIYYMPMIKIDDNIEFFTELKDAAYKVVTTSLDTNSYYSDVDYGEKYAIVVGNEGQGVSDEIMEISDVKVKIPIYGKAESLNVAIATALMLYEAKKSC